MFFGYILACVRDITEIFASTMGFSGSTSSYRMISGKFYDEKPGCHGNRIWAKWLSLYNRYL